jgi:DNA-binding NarL/FixJ family response regulator
MCTCPDSTRSGPLRVFILSGHELVRHALTDLLLQEGIDVVGDEATVTAAVPAVVASGPDIALLSNRLVDGTGIEACRALRDAAPTTRCLVMTTYDEPKAQRAAALAGAAGYVPQSARPQPLLDAVRRVAAGDRLCSRAAAHATLLTLRTCRDLAGASRQERAIWSLIVHGRTNSEIMTELALPPEAFSTHLSALLDRLGYRPAPPVAEYRPDQQHGPGAAARQEAAVLA